MPVVHWNFHTDLLTAPHYSIPQASVIHWAHIGRDMKNIHGPPPIDHTFPQGCSPDQYFISKSGHPCERERERRSGKIIVIDSIFSPELFPTSLFRSGPCKYNKLVSCPYITVGNVCHRSSFSYQEFPRDIYLD